MKKLLILAICLFAGNSMAFSISQLLLDTSKTENSCRGWPTKKIKIRLNVPMKGYPAGKILSIEADCMGVPVENFWKNRYMDAPIDNCITVLDN